MSSHKVSPYLRRCGLGYCCRHFHLKPTVAGSTQLTKARRRFIKGRMYDEASLEVGQVPNNISGTNEFLARIEKLTTGTSC